MFESTDVVAFAGDWHGEMLWSAGRISSLAAQGIKTIFHVGDFGLWPGPSGKKFLMVVEKNCAKAGVTILVTPGNHEDWARIDSRTPKDRGDGWGAVIWLTDHIAVLPRGWRTTLTTSNGVVRSLVSLGGAPSIDFEYRTAGRNWWPSEMMTDAHVAEVVTGGHADIMVAHDAPDWPYQVGPVATICATNPMGWSRDALAYAKVGRDRITRAYEGVAPKVFFHGHYHAPGRKEVTVGGHDGLVVSLDMQQSASNIALLDLNTLTVL